MENIGWGLQITMVGMALVFALLAMLWGLLTLVMRFDRPPPAVASGSSAATEGASGPDATAMDPDLVAAILIAALAHKAWRRQEAAPLMRAFLPGSQLYASRWVASGRMRQNYSWRRGGR